MKLNKMKSMNLYNFFMNRKLEIFFLLGLISLGCVIVPTNNCVLFHLLKLVLFGFIQLLS